MSLEAMLGESQMTVAGAIQCRYPKSTTWKKHFFTQKKSPIKKKKKSVLIFLFSLSLFLFFQSVCFSLIFFLFVFSLFYFRFSFRSLVLFTRSRQRLRRLRTPGPLHRCPWGQGPRWANGRSSAICTRLLSCPTALCVSVERERSHSHCQMTDNSSRALEHLIGSVSV